MTVPKSGLYNNGVNSFQDEAQGRRTRAWGEMNATEMLLHCNFCSRHIKPVNAELYH